LGGRGVRRKRVRWTAEQMRMMRLEGPEGLILPALSARVFIGCADFAEVPML